MSTRGNAAPDAGDDAIEAALVDHHLDEVADMIERARADKRSSETPSDDVPAGYPQAS
jgi:hypothetical protein